MILKNLNKTLSIAKRSLLYSKKLKGFLKRIKNINDLSKLPLTTKEELRDCYPFGNIAVPFKEIIEVHTSSGTTGKSVLSFFTKKDIKIGSREISKAWKCFGIGKDSRVQFAMSYGLFSGAMLNSYAIQELGGFILPAGIQPAARQIRLMIDFQIDTLVATPGYYLYLYDYSEQNKISLKKLFLKRGIAAGEIYSDKIREEIEHKFKIKIFDHYGLCEVNTGIAYECAFRNGLHLLDNYVIAEIINPETGEVLPMETEGELVLTSLKKEASPIIRYRTGDITSMYKGKCPCGRNTIRIGRIKRRMDDLIFIKGIKIDPYELKEYILKIARDHVYSDIKIRIMKDSRNKTPEILVSLRNPSDIKFLEQIKKALKEETLLRFDVNHVNRSYFRREENNKVKFVEYVDK